MHELNRRQFLAAGAVGATGLAVENKQRALRAVEKPWNAGVERSLRRFRDPLPTACPGCDAHCALVAFRDGDRAVQVAPNPAAGRLGAACPRAYQMLEACYDPERVLRPLARVGARGEGRWVEIPWGEALGRVAKALAADPASAYVDLGRPDPLAGPLLERLGVTRIAEHDASRAWTAREVQRAVYGAELGLPDLARARTVLLVGARPLDQGACFAPFARDLVAARERGVRVVALGPYGGVTGSLASEWVPVRPGTEGLVLLGLVRVLLSEGWLNREAFGRVVASAPEELLEALLPYTPEFVEQASGLPANRLVKLARGFSAEGPGLCLVDASGTHGAGALEGAAAVLNAAGGNPEGAGVRLARVPEWVPRLAPTLPRARAVKDLLAGGERASLVLAYRSNPVYWSPRSEAVRRVFADEGRVGLLVAFDTHRTETAELADLVLPAAADLECWNLFGGYQGDGRPYAVLQQPVTPRAPEARALKAPDTPLEALFDGPGRGPLGQARQLGDVLLELLALLEHPARAEFPFADTGSYLQERLAGVPEVAAGLLGDGTWVGAEPAYPWAAGVGFATPSGKLEVAGLLVHRVPRDLKALAGEDFALVILSHPELGAGFANTRWGREIRFENPVYLNPEAAARLGLEAGDRVRLRTQVGEATARVRLVQGLHPQAAALAEDFGHWAGGVAATARNAGAGGEGEPLLVSRKGFLTNPLGAVRPAPRPAAAPWWHRHGPGVSVSALSPFASDERGAQTWRDLRVTIHPV